MKNIILIRHAKSSWQEPINDIDRPLEDRGMADAHLVAQYCIKFLPETILIWSSNAKRASETARIFAQNISYPTEDVVLKEELYTFEESKLEKVIKSCNNDNESLILFGHNEAITNFVNKFGDILIENVPTSGFVSIQFDTDDWQTIKKGKTIKTIFPKDLR